MGFFKRLLGIEGSAIVPPENILILPDQAKPVAKPMSSWSPKARPFVSLGARYGWLPEQEQKNIGLLILTKGADQVNVYYTKMTIGTAIAHPTKGKTQLFRRNVSMAELEKIFANPRAHTGKGYYERGRGA